jgi:ubiquitin carboxyl-terminal hydrolase L5
MVASETEKNAKWKIENERRRHNYVPFIFELLKVLAKKNKLESMFDDATEKKKKAYEEKNKAEKTAA